MKCVFLNVGGLGVRRCKLDEIAWHYNAYHLIILPETWLKDSGLKDLDHISINNYDIYCLNRKIIRTRTRRPSGGVMCLVRSDVKHTISRMNIDNDDVMWLKFNREYYGLDKELYLGVVYFSPDQATRHAQADSDVYRTLELQVSELINRFFLMLYYRGLQW